MDYPDNKGVTNRSHLNQIWDQTGSKPEQYKDPSIPIAGEDLLYIFWELRTFCGDAITWSDIYHYGLLHQIRFKNYELKILQRLNSEFNKWTSKKLRNQNKAKSKSKPSSKPRPISKRPGVRRG